MNNSAAFEMFEIQFRLHFSCYRPFQVKSLPPLTPAAVHTVSDNHWSSQETMQQYVREVIVPYGRLRVFEHKLTIKPLVLQCALRAAQK